MSQERENYEYQTANKMKKTSQETKDTLYRMVYGQDVPIKNAAEFLGISYATARRILSEIKKKEDYENKEMEVEEERYVVGEDEKRRGAPTKMTEEILNIIDSVITHNPGITLKGISRILNNDHGITLSKSSVGRGLDRLGITLKDCSKVLDRVNSEDTLRKRREYAEIFINNAPRDPSKLIYIDESGFNLHLRRKKARSRRGTRASVVIPTVRGRNITLILAINDRNVIHYKLISETTCNSEIFRIFCEELLEIISTKEELSNSWIIMDNSRIHKIESLRNNFSFFGCSFIFLSPYSYMLNPVEYVFSKIKGFVRSSLPISTEDNTLLDIIIDGMNTITENDLQGYFRLMVENVNNALLELPFY
jgi:transposase